MTKYIRIKQPTNIPCVGCCFDSTGAFVCDIAGKITENCFDEHTDEYIFVKEDQQNETD